MGLRGQQGGAFLQLSEGLGISVLAPSVQSLLAWGSDLVKRIQVCARVHTSPIPPRLRAHGIAGA